MPLQSPHGWFRLLMKWNILIGVTYESEFAPIQTAKNFCHRSCSVACSFRYAWNAAAQTSLMGYAFHPSMMLRAEQIPRSKSISKAPVTRPVFSSRSLTYELYSCGDSAARWENRSENVRP